MARIASINVNPAGGVPKHPVESTFIHVDVVEGDKQRNLKFHGGPSRAVCLYSLERIKALQAEGHPIRPGNIGENLTIEGLDWDALEPGVCLEIGDEVQLRIASYTVPCRNIAFAFHDRNSLRVSQVEHPGWARLYARVLQTGQVRVGDAVGVIPNE